MSTSLDNLLRRTSKNGIIPPEGAAPLLDRYVAYLVERGKRLSLVSSGDRDAETIIANHIADALHGLLFAMPEEGAKVLDFGSGGGVVGIPWAVIRPDLDVTLLESKHRKILFLRGALRELEIENAREEEGRGEGDHLAGTFDLVVSRGVATDAKCLAVQKRLVRPGGKLIFFKGPKSVQKTKTRISREPGLVLHDEKLAILDDEKMRIFLAALREVSHSR